MRQMKATDGSVLYKKIKAKVFSPWNQKHIQYDHRAPAGQGISEQGVAMWLKAMSDAIEKQWPGHEYRLVELSPSSFNFVWVREIAEEASNDAQCVPVEPSSELIAQPA
jgi:hypothetical protein